MDNFQTNSTRQNLYFIWLEKSHLIFFSSLVFKVFALTDKKIVRHVSFNYVWCDPTLSKWCTKNGPALFFTLTLFNTKYPSFIKFLKNGKVFSQVHNRFSSVETVYNAVFITFYKCAFYKRVFFILYFDLNLCYIKSIK